MSDDIGVNAEPFGGANTPEDKLFMKILSQQFESIFENCGMTAKNRDAVRDAAVDGDCCFYCWFDPEERDGAGNAGQVQVEAVENTRVYFGNPQVWEVQKQPYIICLLYTSRCV